MHSNVVFIIFIFVIAREYLERLIIASKGSVERTKARVDRLCTFRSLWPELFTVSNIHNFASYRSIL